MNLGPLFGNIVINALIFTLTGLIAVYFIYSMVRARTRSSKARQTKKELESELAELESKYADEAKKLEDKWRQRKRSLKGASGSEQ